MQQFFNPSYFFEEASTLLDEAFSACKKLSETEDREQQFGILLRAVVTLAGGALLCKIEPLTAHLAKLGAQIEAFKTQASVSSDDQKAIDTGFKAARDMLDEARQKLYADSPPSAMKPNTPNHPGRVLLVDDEPEVLEILRALLDFHGFSVFTSNQPENVVAMSQSVSPDVLITDYKMPGMNGLQVAVALKKVKPELPIIFVSGYVSKDLLLSLIQTGVHDVIEKPFDEKRIIQTVTSAIQKYRTQILMNRSIDFIMYQYADLDTFLEKSGNQTMRSTLRAEIRFLLLQRRLLNQQNEKLIEQLKESSKP